MAPIAALQASSRWFGGWSISRCPVRYTAFQAAELRFENQMVEQLDGAGIQERRDSALGVEVRFAVQCELRTVFASRLSSVAQYSHRLIAGFLCGEQVS
jgi:hypothetical protein